MRKHFGTSKKRVPAGSSPSPGHTVTFLEKALYTFRMPLSTLVCKRITNNIIDTSGTVHDRVIWLCACVNRELLYDCGICTQLFCVNVLSSDEFNAVNSEGSLAMD